MKNIYIVLSQTGTLFSKAIKKYTKDPYNHASISFDSDLKIMYSFGRRRRYNFLNSGFVKENFYEGVFSFFPNANCCVFEVPVTEAEYDAMYQIVNSFSDNWQKYRYNLIGVITYVLGICIRRQDHFFCSQFVSYVLSSAGFWGLTPELTKPMDFYKIPNKKLVFEGNINDYKVKQIHCRQLVS